MTTTVDWAGCATFRIAVDDTIVFLDAYLERPPGTIPTGLTATGVERADWILVGHSHADHLWGAHHIAANTGATIVGSYETVRVMGQLGVPDAQLVPVSGGERIRLRDGALVSVFPSMHACAWAEAGHGLASDRVCLGDLGVDWHARNERWEATVASMGDLAAQHPPIREYVGRRQQLGYRLDGGPLAYMIETSDGSLLFQDTAGCWTSLFAALRPDVAILAAAGRGNLDGEPIQGSLAEFVATEVELLRAGKVILCHHDEWMPGMTSAVDVGPIASALRARCPGTSLVDLDYMSAYRPFGA